jgi:hypothetical protein
MAMRNIRHSLDSTLSGNYLFQSAGDSLESTKTDRRTNQLQRLSA